MLMSDRDPVDIFRDIFIEDAYREGKAENTEEIVLNLLSNYDVDFETISDIVRIDVGEVIEIRDKYFS